LVESTRQQPGKRCTAGDGRAGGGGEKMKSVLKSKKRKKGKNKDPLGLPVVVSDKRKLRKRMLATVVDGVAPPTTMIEASNLVESTRHQLGRR
jgi:hypothetical protein